MGVFKALFLHFPSLRQPFLSKFLPPFRPMSPLALVNRAISTAKSLTSAFDIEKVSALRICAEREVPRIGKLAPKE